MLLFRENYQYNDPLNVVFLCGSNYEIEDTSDKRNILRKYIENNFPDFQPIILEEHFWFKKTNKKYFSYDDIFLNNLAQIEKLAALFAWKIIIIHESISTAAEIGAFAIDPILAKKICVLFPDSFAIEERKISSFIKLAFFARKSFETNIHKKIKFYPDVEVIRKSPNKSEYYTYFHNEEIGENLGENISSFLIKENTKTKFEIKNFEYGQISTNDEVISYSIKNNKIIAVVIPSQIFKVQILSLFFQEEFRRNVRKGKLIYQHVSFIEKYYIKIMKSTIEMISGKQIEGYEPEWRLQKTECSLRKAIGYFIYMLQASKFICLEQVNENSKIRKMTLSRALDKCEKIKEVLYNTEVSTFGRLNV